MSTSTVFDSLERSKYATLISEDKRIVNRKGLLDLLIYDVKYFFPTQSGPLMKGTATAHSYSLFQNEFSSNVAYVWQDDNGLLIGQEIEPLYKNQIFAIKHDEKLYEILALIDLLRIGNKREISFAQKELNKILLE